MKQPIVFHHRGTEESQRFTESFSLCTSVQTLCLCGEKILFFFLLLFVASCGNPEIKPVDIAAEDVCTHCKMAISERQFASEIITTDGDALKFDDIGCMQDYLKEKPDTKAAAYFFMDYETKQWVKGDNASFVKSKEITSPMGGGMIAFQDKTKAEAAATKFKGQSLNFAELIKK
jgi:copper chaperone NosL